MHTESVERWMHDHTFGQDEKRSARSDDERMIDISPREIP